MRRRAPSAWADGLRRLISWLRQRAVIITYAVMGLVLVAGLAVVFGLLDDERPAPPSGDDPGSNGLAVISGGPSASASASAAPSASASASPSPSARPIPSLSPVAPPSRSGYPNASNTGVPYGTRLTTYTGPCTITANNTVIDAKIVNCKDGLGIRAKNVIIKRSRINGPMGTSEETAHSYTLEDSEVNAGVIQRAAVGSTNLTIRRSNIHGGQTSVYCFSNCDIRDSWLHGQGLAAGVDWHLGAFLANDNGSSGRTNAVLVHNTIVCDTPTNGADGGCSGNINLFGDFGPISYVTVDNNFLGANTGISYCIYGGDLSSKPYPHADHVVIVNNVIARGSNGKCGAYGPVDSFNPSGPGNRWENNVWDTGGEVKP